MAAMLIPMVSAAQTDTTLIVNNKKIVINDSLGQTRISIYGTDGQGMTKLKEISYINGQEIEQVYVSSPFFPQRNKYRRHNYRNHIPSFYMGMSMMSGGFMHFNGATGLHVKESKSYEWGLSALNFAFPLNRQRTIGLSVSMQAGFTHHSFESGYALFNNDGQISVDPVEVEGMKKSYISYQYCRLPVIMEWQNKIGGNTAYIGAGLSFDIRGNERSRYKYGKEVVTPTHDINLHTTGINLEILGGYAGIVFYLRSSLTPLLKTGFAPTCHTTSIGWGVVF